MKQEHDDFARLHPSLDRALREQAAAPRADGAFRQQVFARIAVRRAELARAATEPDSFRSRLRTQFLLQVLNQGAIALAAVLLLAAVAPQLGSLPGITAPLASVPASWMQQAGLIASMAVGGAALLYGLQRARLLDWLRGL